MNEIRTLMETIAKINEAELPPSIGSGGGNADIVYAYDEQGIYGRERNLQEIGEPGNLDTWYEVMKVALGWADNEYNDFNADNVYQILKGYENSPYFTYFAAREYSPAMYITARARSNKELEKKLQGFERYITENQQELRVSEINILPNTNFSSKSMLRHWWD